MRSEYSLKYPVLGALKGAVDTIPLLAYPSFISGLFLSRAFFYI